MLRKVLFGALVLMVAGVSAIMWFTHPATTVVKSRIQEQFRNSTQPNPPIPADSATTSRSLPNNGKVESSPALHPPAPVSAAAEKPAEGPEPEPKSETPPAPAPGKTEKADVPVRRPHTAEPRYHVFDAETGTYRLR